MLEELVKGQPFIIAILVIAVATLSTVVVFLYRALRTSDAKIDLIRQEQITAEREYKDKMIPALDKLITASETNNAVLNVISNQRDRG